jgi:hypothetical protein
VSTHDDTGDAPPDDLAADVVGRALHALEPDEEARVAEHLQDCEACRSLLAQTHETMAVLAHAVPALDPPPELRARLLAAAAAEPAPVPDRREPVPRTTAAREQPLEPPRAESLEAAPESPTGPTGPDRPIPPPVPMSWRSAAVLLLTAVVAAVVVLVARGAVGPDANDPRVAAVQRAQQVVASAQARDPFVRTASLVEPSSGTVAAVVLDGSSGRRVVPVDMPTAGAGRAVVLWRVAGNDASPIATVDPTGSLTPMPVPAGAPSTSPPAPGRAYALSLERAGTVPTQPSVVVASGPLV